MWIIGSIIFLLVLVYILIQVPAVQNFARGKIVSYLENKIHTKVEIGKLSIAFPKQIVLENVYFEDQKKDTLFAGKELRVDISLFKLISKEVDVQYLELNGIRANIYRVLPDTTFNFEYIVKAFVSEQNKPTKPADTTSSLKFHLGQIVFKNILATFKDDVTGNDVYFFLGSFKTNIDKFDPSHQIYEVPKIQIANIDTRIHQYKPLIQSTVDTSTTASSSPPSIKINELNLQQIKFYYLNDLTGQLADLNIGEFLTHPQNINLQTLDIALKDVALNNTNAKIILSNTKESQMIKKKVADTTAAELSKPWKFTLAKISFNNNTIFYDDNTKPKAPAGMDFSHMHIQNFIVDGNDLSFTPAEFKGNINQISFKEQNSNFNLQKFQTKFYYSDTAASLQHLFVQTDKTLLRDGIALRYPSIKNIAKQPGEIYINANLKQCTLGTKDMLTLAPQLATSLKGNENTVLYLNTNIKGFVKDLSIPVFQLSGLNNTAINLSGNIKGLPDAKNAFYNINIAQFKTSRSDIYQLVSAKTIPSNIRIPQALQLKGFFKGSMNDFATQLNLNTTNGGAFVKATMRNKSSYVADVALNNLNVGYLTKQDSMLGRITLQANIAGSGLDAKNANAKLKVNLEHAEIKGYDYKNLTLSGNIARSIVNVNADMNDENIRFNLTANANIKTKFPSDVQLQLLLDTINLNKLHLMKDTLSLHGNIAANLPSANPDSLVGNISINNIAVYSPKQNIKTDSIELNATANGNQKTLNLSSEFLKANLSGGYKLTEIAPALQQTINKYYHLASVHDSVLHKIYATENWQLNATFIPSPLVLQFMPGMKGSDSVLINSSYNNSSNNLSFSAKSKRIIFNTNQIDSLNILAQTNANNLGFNISVQGAKASSIQLFKTSLDGNIANNIIDMNLNVDDSKNKSQYQLGAVINSLLNGIKLSLKPNLLLDYDKWNVGADNFIQYDSTGVLVHNFSVSQGNQSLSINSTAQTMDAPVEVKFSNFQIATITKFAHQDSLLAEGAINGNILVNHPTKNPVFTTDLTINNLIYKKDTIGNITAKVNNQQANAFAANVTLKGNNTDLDLTGMYYTGESRMDLKLNVNSLNLAIAKPFAVGQLDDIGGILKANATITGTISKPTVNGNVHFENAFIVPTISGERFTLSNDVINIDPQGIHFGNFTLLDSAKNEAVVTGDIFTTDFKQYRFAVNLDAQNFRAVNAPQASNRMFYGKLNIDVHAKLTGDMVAPKADVNLRINKETDFTLVLPSNDPEVVSRAGVVKFVDKDHPDTVVINKTYLDSISNNTEVKGMDVAANIETDSAAKFTMVIDERNGDALTVQGRSNLTAGIDQSGKLSLTGSYELTHGAYTVSLSVLKRQFTIQRGSTITWTGDPKLAQIDITAIYLANTAPIDLVQSQIAGRSQAELNRFKQKLPFQVLLRMQGELLQPIITFDIALPQDILSQWPDVSTKLQQVKSDPNELNKQVFALLLLNRFVQEDPLVSSGPSSGVGDMVRQSASRILTDQLNQLAGSLIKGVDINFDLNSQQDYTTGVEQQRTDLNVTVSKKLLNDRLQVNVGSNFEVEGKTNPNQQASNIAGDVSVDYQLSKDGRYRIRVYRRNNYEEVVEGQVIETGVSFILTLDYNQFKEIFEGKKSVQRKLKKQQTK